MDKNFAIVLGAGRSGISATKALTTIKNCYVYLYDENDKLDVESIKKILPDTSTYELRLSNITYDEINKIKLCVISPGFPKYKEIDYSKRAYMLCDWFKWQDDCDKSCG